MRIKATKSLYFQEIATWLKKGDIVDLETEKAQRLLTRGLAEAIVENASEVKKPKTTKKKKEKDPEIETR